MCQPVTLVRLQYAYTTKQFSAGQVSQDVEPSPNELTQAPSLHLLHGSLVCAQVGVVDINATPPNARAVPNTRRLIMVRMACLQDGCLIERLTGFQEHILETLSIDAQYPPPRCETCKNRFWQRVSHCGRQGHAVLADFLCRRAALESADTFALATQRYSCQTLRSNPDPETAQTDRAQPLVSPLGSSATRMSCVTAPESHQSRDADVMHYQFALGIGAAASPRSSRVAIPRPTATLSTLPSG